jgi:hypothetical protein
MRRQGAGQRYNYESKRSIKPVGQFFVVLSISVNRELGVVTTLRSALWVSRFMPTEMKDFQLQKSDYTCPGGRCQGSRHYD